MPDGHTWLWPMMAARSLLAEPGARPALLDGAGRAWAALAAGMRWRGEAVVGTTLRHHPSGAEHAWFLRWPR